MATQSRFIGRAGELAALLDVLATARAGPAAFALVGGEAGIGKTRLLEEFTGIARSDGWPVVGVRVPATAGAPAFWPWRQLLQRWTDDVGGPELAAAAAVHGPHVARIVPELGTATEPAPVAAEERFSAFARFGRLLTDAAGPGVVLLLDDLHWADADTLALLASVVEQVRAAPLVLIGTFRPRELAATPGGAALRSLVGRHGVALQLGGFTGAEVDADLHALLGTRQDASVVAAVTERTRGNPLFVREISRLLATGLAPDAHLPELIREVIGQHLAGLPAGCRAMLAVAAVIGPDADPHTLAAVTGADVADVLAHLDDGVRGGVLDARFAFVHDLFRETLLQDQPLTERAGTHLRVATALERSAAPRLAEIARHRLAALPLGDPAAASAAAHAAGAEAVAHLAFTGATDLFASALATAPDDMSPAARCALLVSAGQARFLGRDVDGALELCTAAGELALRTGDAELLGRACLALPEFTDPRWTLLVATWCEQALAGLPDGPLRAQVLAQQAMSMLFTGSSDEQLAAASATALATARRVGDDTALRLALRARQLACSDPAGHAERLVLGAEMVTLGRRSGDLESVFWGHLWRFDALVQAGHVDHAAGELDQADPIVARLGRPVPRWHLLRSRVAVEIGRGRFAVAQRLVDQELDLVPGGLTARAPYWSALQIARLTGDSGNVPADPLPPDYQHPVAAFADYLHLAPWHLQCGRRAEAAAIHRAMPGVGSAGIPRFVTMAIDAARCWVSAALGDTAAAQAGYDALLPHADLHVAPGAGVSITLGSAQLPLGIAAAACGRGDAAVDHLRAAVTANERSGLHPFTAMARYHLAAALHARGDLRAARQEARLSMRVAEQLGMAPLRAQASELVGGMAHPEPLTARQREIAELVARGLGNRQIAAQLQISERTAENHVHNIMTALGVGSRVQVATWITRDPFE